MIRFIMVLILLLTVCAPSWAQDAIGFVKTVSGNAVIIDAGRPIKAQVGTPIKMGNMLNTGPKGTMGVTFKDNTVMSFGPDSELTVDEYLYAPEKDNLKFGSSLSKGSLQVVSGVIAKLKPQSANMKTPTGTIGIRGTRFLVKVEPEKGVVLMENADKTVGQLAVSGAQGEVLLNQSRTGADLDDTGKTPFAVDENRINRDFGEAITAQPPLPVSFMLYYKRAGTVLTDESQAMIPTILEAARNHPAPDVSVIGHTDTVGDGEANQQLGLQRAQSVAEIIKRAGLQVHDMTITSHGERNLLVATPDNTPEPKNRRVEITVR